MKEEIGLPEYNTVRGKLELSEYGRNLQKMVEYAVNEPDKEKRNRLAQALITLMGNLNPHLRDVADYKHKLWDHLFVISDFKLDADSPYPKPTRESILMKPDMVAYPQSRIRFRFYGKNIEQMIRKAADMEDGPVKSGFINLIGSFMKNACRTWNEEQLSDEEILAHLEMLSGGRISMTDGEDVQFNALQYNTNQRNDRNDRNDRGGNNNRNQNRNNNQNRYRGNNNSGGGQGNNQNRNRNNDRNDRNDRNGGGGNSSGGGGNRNNNNNNRNFRNKNRGN